MAIAPTFKVPGLSDWIAPRRNSLMGFAAGLAQGNGFGEGIGYGLQGAMQGRQADDAYATQQKAEEQRVEELNKTVQWLQEKHPDLAGMVANGMPVGEAWQTALERMKPQAGMSPTADIQNYEYGLQNPGFVEAQSQKGGQAEMSLQPTWMQDAQGKWFIGQLTKDGRVVRTGTPDGMSVVPPADIAGARAAGTLEGKTEAQAAVDLPAAVAKGEYAVDQLKGLLSTVPGPDGLPVPNQGFEEQFGMLGPIPIGQTTPAIPSTAKAGFQARLNQVQGQAFLQAFESLKGGGAISEVEGLKAQQAIIRASTSQSREDFEAAVKEAIAIYEAGIERAKELVRSGVKGRADQVLGGAPPGSDIDSILGGYGL